MRSSDLDVDIGWTTAGNCSFNYEVRQGKLVLTDIWVVLKGLHREQAKRGEGPPIMGVLPDIARGFFTRYRVKEPMSYSGALLCATENRKALVYQDHVIELFFEGGLLTDSLDHSERIAALRSKSPRGIVVEKDLREGLRGDYPVFSAAMFDAMAAKVDKARKNADADSEPDTALEALKEKIRLQRAQQLDDEEPEGG